MKKTLRSTLFALALSPLALSACGGAAGISTDGENAADSADTASVTASMSSLTTDGVDASATTADAAAMSAQVKAMALLQPQGCATAVVTGSSVAYTFNNCTGPYGLLNLSGNVTANYTMVAGGGVTVTLSGSNLKANGSTVTLNATAIVTGTAGSRQAAVTSSTSAQTSRGRTISHSGNYTAGWDGSCLSLNGSFTTQIGLLGWSTTIANYKRCQGMCPASGTVVITAGANTATVTFANSATVTFTDNKGNTGTVTLQCK